jgi:hypothetical protein
MIDSPHVGEARSEKTLKKVIQKLLLENGTPWKYGVFSDISRY